MLVEPQPVLGAEALAAGHAARDVGEVGRGAQPAQVALGVAGGGHDAASSRCEGSTS